MEQTEEFKVNVGYLVTITGALSGIWYCKQKNDGRQALKACKQTMLPLCKLNDQTHTERGGGGFSAQMSSGKHVKQQNLSRQTRTRYAMRSAKWTQGRTMWERTDGSSRDSWECRNDCIVTVGAKHGAGTNWTRQGQTGEREAREDEKMSCRHVSSTKLGFQWGVSECNRSKKDSLCVSCCYFSVQPRFTLLILQGFMTVWGEKWWKKKREILISS